MPFSIVTIDGFNTGLNIVEYLRERACPRKGRYSELQISAHPWNAKISRTRIWSKAASLLPLTHAI
ncbi:protein of unknown function [Pseudomonas inefficax]|uniref:Uncharacterized protein n=1 Tax=Pseudomonas inefficax TaxID=2078786 RepID=A0AAQ1P793_9PSED|nr:protein of unknown function [Pseudomonas inefficax]